MFQSRNLNDSLAGNHFRRNPESSQVRTMINRNLELSQARNQIQRNPQISSNIDDIQQNLRNLSNNQFQGSPRVTSNSNNNLIRLSQPVSPNPVTMNADISYIGDHIRHYPSEPEIEIPGLPLIGTQSKFLVAHGFQILVAIIAIIIAQNTASSRVNIYLFWIALILVIMASIISKLYRNSVRETFVDISLFLIFTVSFALLATYLQQHWSQVLVYWLVMLILQCFTQIVFLATSKVNLNFSGASISIFVGALLGAQWVLIGTEVQLIHVIAITLFSFIWGQQELYFLVFTKYNVLLPSIPTESSLESATNVYLDFIFYLLNVVSLLNKSWLK